MAINHFEYHARLTHILRKESQKLPTAWHQQPSPLWMSLIVAACSDLERETEQAKQFARHARSMVSFCNSRSGQGPG
jgi:hypothetical protein